MSMSERLRVSSASTIIRHREHSLVEVEIDEAAAAPRVLRDLCLGAGGARFALRDACGRGVASRAALAALARPAALEPRAVVAYPAPPEGAASAAAAAAFLAVSSWAAAAPLGPPAGADMVGAALDAVRADVVLAWRGQPSAALELAAARRGVPVREARLALDGDAVRFDVDEAERSPRPARSLRGASARSLASVFAAASARPLRSVEPSRPGDVAVVLRTSGTTSRPKGVPLEHAQLCANAICLAASFRLSAADVCANAMPLHHVGGLAASVAAPLGAGGSTLFLPGAFSAAALVDALAVRDGPTWYSAAPTIHNAVFHELARRRSPPRHRLRVVRSGAAALRADHAARLSEALGGAAVVGTYSMTELMPIAQPPAGFDQLARKPGSVGVPVAASVALVADDLTTVPRGAVGEICLRGDAVARRYVGAGVGADAFVSIAGGRWFRTGDLATFDGDGHLTIVGRAKELIKVGGEQVAPGVVEAAVAALACVRTAVAFPVASSLYGEEVGVAVSLRGPPPDDVARAARAACAAAGLPPPWLPRAVVVVDEADIERTSTGKVKRRAVKDLARRASLAATGKGLSVEYSGLRVGDDGAAPLALSPALDGAKFLCTTYIMLNHVGASTGRRSLGVVAKMRYFNLAVPCLFAIIGAQLAVGFRPIPKKAAFAAARIGAIHPLYLATLVPCLVVVLVQCRPGTARDFEWSGHPTDDGDLASQVWCEPAPLIGDWGGSLVATLVVYALGVQCWGFWPFVWQLSYYSWFVSVYYGLLFVFPFFYRALLPARGDERALWFWCAAVLAANLAVCAGFAVMARALREAPTELAIWSLSVYEFPLAWAPCLFVGSVGAFLADARRDDRDPTRRRRAGRATDAASVLFAVVIALYAIESPIVRPRGAAAHGAETHREKVAERVFLYTLSRVGLAPLCAWLYGLALGAGVTARLLASPWLAIHLAPLGMGNYLLHQPVSEIYYAATRPGLQYSFWRYRKSFYWFSPFPLPVSWMETIVVMVLTTACSSVLTRRLNPTLVSLWQRATAPFLARAGIVDDSDPNDRRAVVAAAIGKLTGITPDYVALEIHTLDQCGVTSASKIVLLRMLDRAFPARKLTLADLVRDVPVADIVALLDDPKDVA